MPVANQFRAVEPLSTESLSDTPELAAPACIVCGGFLQRCVSRLFDTRFGIEGSYETDRCGQCGLEQLSPAPTPARLKELYERNYNFGGEHDTLYTKLRQWYFSSPLHRLWARLDGDISFYTCKGSGRLLDIGCNEGRGLKIYASNGYEVEGLELNEKAASVARGEGFAVHTESLERLTPAKAFDVAVLSNVLEHSLDPAQMLRNVRRILKPGGEVWISCPNSRSWLRSCFGRYWINWHVPFHIVHFSSSTLERMLSHAGFSKIRTREITPSLWVASSMITRLFAREGKPTRQLRNPFLVFGLMLLARLLLFPVLILGNLWGRGDCLLAIAATEKAIAIDSPLRAPAGL
ncbi:MAG TPA: class I SAM-dependent methyltransferase [Terriglobales bacterium]|nr:class I SAM-dependent methyltransferase [Terriglobales bacterium]